MTRRLRPSPWAASELDIQLETLDIEKDPDILAVLTRYSGGVLTVEEGADLWAIRAGLIGLSNGCDEWASRSECPDQRRFNRWARDGLSALVARI